MDAAEREAFDLELTDEKKSNWWSRRPLTFKMMFIITALLIAGSSVISITMLGIFQSHLVKQVDEQLAQTAPALVNDVVNSVIQQRETSLPSNYYVNVQTQDDPRAIVLITSATRAAYGIPTPGQVAGPNVSVYGYMSNPVTLQSDKQGGPAWRAVAVPVYRGDKQIGMGTVALPLVAMQSTLRNLAWYLAVTSLLLVILGLTASYYLVSRSLRPLRDIEAKAGRIAGGDLSLRIDAPPASTEIGSLARSLNKMLERIEHSFVVQARSEKKIRQFISDASHELRTPLAAIRGYGELYRMGAVPPDNVADVFGRIESESRRMATMVEDLVALARLDEGRTLDLQPVNAIELVRNAALDLEALDPGRPVEVIELKGNALGDDYWIEADRDQITQVLTNLSGNIIHYTPKGSPVEIAIGKRPDAIIIEMRDHGPGVGKADIDHIFERFYRADYSRSRKKGGSGLGLAIVSAIIWAHEGEVRGVTTPGGGLTVRITLPRIENPAHAEDETADLNDQL